MLKYILGFSVIIPLLFSCADSPNSHTQDDQAVAVAETAEREAPQHKQLVVVQTAHWDAVQGTLARFEWEDGAWRRVGEDWSIVVGKSGMAWGQGMKTFTNVEGPIKKEGDKRSPAGVFVLGSAFGYALSPTGISVPYIPVVSTTMCIEDGTSAYYNQIIDEGDQDPDWNSTDHMLRKDDLYEWGVFVSHNSPDAKAGKGSCIFLHVWRQSDSGTAGCTAMQKAHMKALIEWLEPGKSPILIQMPTSAQELAIQLRELSVSL